MPDEAGAAEQPEPERPEPEPKGTKPERKRARPEPKREPERPEPEAERTKPERAEPGRPADLGIHVPRQMLRMMTTET